MAERGIVNGLDRRARNWIANFLGPRDWTMVHDANHDSAQKDTIRQLVEEDNAAY